MTDPHLIARRIAEAVKERGGSVYYVGGCVRDELLGIGGKDIDIEVHGVTPETLTEILSAFGECRSMGTSFGIYGIKGVELDIAMPRRETATGRGHRDFEVYVDPFLGTRKAAMRRDFTVNALMKNVLTGEIVDHFGGLADLKAGVLRHVNDETFAEDALRVLRLAQFAARLGFDAAPETVELCRHIPLDTLARERVEAELEKALVKAARPSVFFEVLRRTDRLDEWFPELKALIGVEQNPRFHAEGDVWNHTMMVIDAAAKYRERVSQPAWFMLSAVTHDFGKAVTTACIDGVWHAYAHETEGLPLVGAFIDRLTSDRKKKEYVLNMTRLHMKLNVLASQRAAVKATNRLFDEAAAPVDLICLAAADDRGRIGIPAPDYAEAFLYERLNVYRETMAKPCVTGAELIAAGVKPSPRMGELLAFAHKLQLACVGHDDALKQTLAMARKGEKSGCSETN